MAITMGSDSDRSVLSPGIGLLKELKIPFSVTITSAHRTPERMFQFAKVSASQELESSLPLLEVPHIYLAWWQLILGCRLSVYLSRVVRWMAWIAS